MLSPSVLHQWCPNLGIRVTIVSWTFAGFRHLTLPESKALPRPKSQKIEFKEILRDIYLLSA